MIWLLAYPLIGLMAFAYLAYTEGRESDRSELDIDMSDFWMALLGWPLFLFLIVEDYWKTAKENISLPKWNLKGVPKLLVNCLGEVFFNIGRSTKK